MDIGSKFQNYQILRQLDRNAVAESYLAQDQMSDEQLVLVTISKQVSQKKNFKELFKNDFNKLKSVDHPNFVKVLDGGIHKGEFYFTKEYVNGFLLSEFLRFGKAPPPIALYIIVQVMRGLSALHQNNLVHGSLNPDNIYIDRATGEVKIGEFGLLNMAQLNQLVSKGAVLDAPAYLAPEQIESNKPNEKTDLYAAGAVLYEMLTGRPPYKGDSPQNVMAKILKEPARPVQDIEPTLTDPIAQFTAELIAYHRDNRLSSAATAETKAQMMLEIYGALGRGRYFLLYVAAPGIYGPHTWKFLSDQYLDYARQIMRQNRQLVGLAALEFRRAALMAPENEEVQTAFQSFCNRNKINIKPQITQQLQNLIDKYKAEPGNDKIFKQIAGIHRNVGNLFEAARCYWKLMARSPNDKYIESQYYNMLGIPQVGEKRLSKHAEFKITDEPPMPDFGKEMPEIPTPQDDDDEDLDFASLTAIDSEIPAEDVEQPLNDEIELNRPPEPDAPQRLESLSPTRKRPDPVLSTRDHPTDHTTKLSRSSTGRIKRIEPPPKKKRHFLKFMFLLLLIAGAGGYFGYENREVIMKEIDKHLVKIALENNPDVGKMSRLVPVLHKLSAAELAWQKGDYATVVKELDSFEKEYLESNVLHVVKLMRAQAMIETGQIESALNVLDELPTNAPPEYQAKRAFLIARATLKQPKKKEEVPALFEVAYKVKDKLTNPKDYGQLILDMGRLKLEKNPLEALKFYNQEVVAVKALDLQALIHWERAKLYNQGELKDRAEYKRALEAIKELLPPSDPLAVRAREELQVIGPL